MSRKRMFSGLFSQVWTSERRFCKCQISPPSLSRLSLLTSFQSHNASHKIASCIISSPEMPPQLSHCPRDEHIRQALGRLVPFFFLFFSLSPPPSGTSFDRPETSWSSLASSDGSGRDASTSRLVCLRLIPRVAPQTNACAIIETAMGAVGGTDSHSEWHVSVIA